MGMKLTINTEDNSTIIVLTNHSIKNYKMLSEEPEGRNEYLSGPMQGLELNGKIDIYDKSGELLELKKLSDWAKKTAHEKDVYRKTVLEFSSNTSEQYETVTLQKAFIVEYIQGFDGIKGVGTFRILLRSIDNMEEVFGEKWNPQGIVVVPEQPVPLAQSPLFTTEQGYQKFLETLSIQQLTNERFNLVLMPPMLEVPGLLTRNSKIDMINKEINKRISQSKVEVVYAVAGIDSKNRLTAEKQKVNAEYIYKYCLKQGWSKEAACGLLGNIQQESYFNPGVWQSDKNTKQGYGLVQWTPADQKILKWMGGLSPEEANDMAEKEKKKLMDLQLEWLIKTCQPGQGEWLQGKAVSDYGSPLKMTFDEFITSDKNPGDLALVFHGHYERSADDERRKQNRIDFANEWYEYFQ